MKALLPLSEEEENEINQAIRLAIRPDYDIRVVGLSLDRHIIALAVNHSMVVCFSEKALNSILDMPDIGKEVVDAYRHSNSNGHKLPF